MRVLVCDDDEEVGKFLRTLFDLEGWQSSLVLSGEECLRAMREGEPADVLILDQVMPGLTGIETAGQLRAAGFERPIILCSGHLPVELSGDVERLDLIPCNKIDLEALCRVVRAAASNARRTRIRAR